MFININQRKKMCFRSSTKKLTKYRLGRHLHFLKLLIKKGKKANKGQLFSSVQVVKKHNYQNIGSLDAC